MSDIDELPRVLEPLRALGVRIAIDDFGTGSSVLRRLQHCRIDTRKIDRSFLSGITRSWHEVPLIKALLSMARGLDLTVVAEGVETEVQADLLNRYGCELAQGWYYSAAVPATEMQRSLEEARPTQPTSPLPALTNSPDVVDVLFRYPPNVPKPHTSVRWLTTTTDSGNASRAGARPPSPPPSPPPAPEPPCLPPLSP